MQYNQAVNEWVLNGAYWIKDEWVPCYGHTPSDILKHADASGARSARVFLDGAIERFVKLGGEWVVI